MKTLWSTYVSGWYQLFIPLYCYSIRKAYPNDYIHVGVVGEADNLMIRAMDCVPDSQVKTTSAIDYKKCVVTMGTHDDISLKKQSTINTLRFISQRKLEYEEPSCNIITDIDLILFNSGHKQYFMDRMNGQPFYGHHGPNKYPKRFKGGWRGDKERIAGGFFMATPDFWETTKDYRMTLRSLLAHGLQEDYREADEVYLCKMIKHHGWKVPPKGFDNMHRGIHLGDFREDMKHRWTNTTKMIHKLPSKTIHNLLILQKDDEYNKILAIIRKNKIVDQIFTNLETHLKDRGFS